MQKNRFISFIVLIIMAVSLSIQTVSAAGDYPKPFPPILPPCTLCSSDEIINTSELNVTCNINTEYFYQEDNSITYFDYTATIIIQNTTTLESAIDIAMTNWNSIGVVNLVEDEQYYNLIIIEEELGLNGIVATYTYYEDSVDVISLNTSYFYDLTELEQVRILEHELGHAMGLKDVSIEDGYYSIMIPGISEVITITSCDTKIIEENLNK